MENKIIIKGKEIGNERPIICVPIVETKKEAIIAEVIRLKSLNVEMIEWRVDAFEEFKNLESVLELLHDIKQYLQHIIFLFTFRSKNQGGLAELEAKQLERLYHAVAETKVVDLMDVEYFENSNSESLISMIQGYGVYVIASHHDFAKTASYKELENLLEDLSRSTADIIKLAVMPKETEDVLRLLSVTNHFHKLHPEKTLVTMSMERIGMISRIAGGIFGSCITFGSGKVASAPGQVDLKDLEYLLNIIYQE